MQQPRCQLVGMLAWLLGSHIYWCQGGSQTCIKLTYEAQSFPNLISKFQLKLVLCWMFCTELGV